MLLKRRAASSLRDLRTVEGFEHSTCEDACRALGLLEDEREAQELLIESINSLDPPPTVRSLFARLTLDGKGMTQLLASTEEVTVHHSVSHTIFSYMALDFARAHITVAEQRNHCLAELDAHLVLHGKSMSDFFPPEWCPRETSRELDRHKLAYDRAEQRAAAAKFPLDSKGGLEQTRVLNWCLSGDPLVGELRKAARVEVGFVQGDGGAGKSWTIKRAIAEVHTRGGVALVSAATAKAATMFRDGHTLHELGGVPVEPDADGHTIVRMQREGGKLTPQRLELLVAADLIVIDEAPSLHKRTVEAFVDMLRVHGSRARVLLSGDFQQIPPVVKSNARDEVAAASLQSSHVYDAATKFKLNKQYRAAEDPEYADAVRSFGDGSLEGIEGHTGNDDERGVRVVEMPLVTTLFHEGEEEYENAALEWLYGVDEHDRLCVEEGSKAILCGTNTMRNKWNDVVSRRLARDAGRSTERTYEAFHKADIDTGVDADEALQRVMLSAMGDDEMERLSHDHSAPASKLTLRVGDSVLLMANMDKKAGLVNNAALRVVELRPNAVICDMDHGGGIATRHVIYRRPFKIKLPGDTPVYVVRRQVPLVQAYAMTINKSQGMTLDRVLFDARRAPFQHGHAYVLFSRVRNRHSVGAVVDDATRRGDHLVTTTVLYDELLCEAGVSSEPMPDAPDCADLDDGHGAVAVSPSAAGPSALHGCGGFDCTCCHELVRLGRGELAPHSGLCKECDEAPGSSVDAQAPRCGVKRDLAESMVEEAAVESALNRLFATGRDDVTMRQLLRELARMRMDMDMGTVEAALAALEDANKVMYREACIYLI